MSSPRAATERPGLFAPEVLRGIGARVTELDCTLDYTFPNYNPNPEDMKMLHAVAATVEQSAPILVWPLTAMATVVALSMMRAKRFSPTRLA